jgi:phosphatidate cytidylyltransferase
MMHDLASRLITGSFIIAALVFALYFMSPAALSAVITGLMLYTLGVEWPQFQCPFLTPLYPVLPFLSLIFFNLTRCRIELLWICVIICAHDTGAYLVGNLCGKHKLWAAVSPGKSWEGVIGGYVASLLASYLFIQVLPFIPVTYFASFIHFMKKISFLQHAFIVLLINISGILGDLFESSLKRSVQIKDSGSILPGHGGVLDRFDSILFAVPFWLVFRLLLIRFLT